MTALKCDRCGKLYEAYCLTLEEYAKSPYKFYRIEKQMIPDNYSHYLDLCLDCQKELGEWIENGKTQYCTNCGAKLDENDK